MSETQDQSIVASAPATSATSATCRPSSTTEAMARIRRRPAARIYSEKPIGLRPNAVTNAELRCKLLAEISGALDHCGYCRLSVTELASRLGSARLAVSLQIAALKYAGVIRRKQAADGRYVTILIADYAADPNVSMGSEPNEARPDRHPVGISA